MLSVINKYSKKTRGIGFVDSSRGANVVPPVTPKKYADDAYEQMTLFSDVTAKLSAIVE